MYITKIGISDRDIIIVNIKNISLEYIKIILNIKNKSIKYL